MSHEEVTAGAQRLHQTPCDDLKFSFVVQVVKHLGANNQIHRLRQSIRGKIKLNEIHILVLFASVAGPFKRFARNIGCEEMFDPWGQLSGKVPLGTGELERAL